MNMVEKRNLILTLGVIGVPYILIWMGRFPSPRGLAAIIIATVIIAAFVPLKSDKE